MKDRKIAIIDIGSNTVRLAIYEQTRHDELNEFESTKVSLRLSRFVKNGILSDEGIELLISVLLRYEETIRSLQVQEVECTATAAIRNAKNHEEILRKVSEHTSFSLRLLSGKEEAYYGILAITHTIPVSDGIAVDLGGGSTEITLFRNQKIIRTASLPFGVVTLANRYSDGIPISGDSFRLMREDVEKQLQTLDWIADIRSSIIGIGGSVRILGRFSMAKNQQNHDLNGYTMTKIEVENLFREMKNMTSSELTSWAKENADLTIPALTVLWSIMDLTGAENLICCTKGIKDGLALEKIGY